MSLWFLVVAGLVLGSATDVGAQATGTITGVVTDESGAVLPGVSVEVVSEATGQTRAVVSGDDGFYTVPLVPPGRYQVKASLAGFRSLTREGVVVSVNNTSRIDLRLQVGDVSESITVEATTPLVDTSNATMGVVIEQEKIVELPLNGRNFTQLGTLIPGVVAPPSALGGAAGDATPGGFGNVTGGFNVNGMRNQSNNFLMDGAPNNDSFNTGFVLRPPPDAIQEFKIQTHSYSAEYGRNAGSVVNVVTRSGSNTWGASVWEFNRDDRLEAKNFFARTKPELTQNQFGAAVGGPILKGRLFAFGYYEGYRNERGTTDTRVVLSEAQRSGNFAGGSAIRDPLTGQPFAGNTIPADRISPIARALLERFIPLPNSPGNRFTRSPVVEDDRNQFGLRLDLKVGDRSSLLGRYMLAKTDRLDPLGGSNFSPSGNVSKATLQDVMFGSTFILRSNVINVARVSYNWIDANPTVTSGLSPSELGWRITPSNPAALGLPFVNVSGFFTAGDAQQPFATRGNRVLSVSDDLTWVVGSHSLKFGVEFRRDAIELEFINRPNGDLTFSGQYTGNAAADFLLGFPIQYRQAAGDPKLDGAAMTYGIFAQDEFRVSNRLTVNLGVRYEVSTPFIEKQDHLNTFRPGQQSQRFPNAPTGLVYPGDPGIPRGTYETDRNNIAPRVGLTWDPFGDTRTAVRAAWGLFYDALPGQGDFFQNGTLAPPFQPLTEVNFPLTATTPSIEEPLRGIAPGNPFPPGLIFIGWGADFESAVVQHYNVSVQRELGGLVGVEVAYVGSRGQNLPMFMEINPTIPILEGTPRRGPRVFPAFSLVRPTFSAAKSWYNSLQASARMRQWRGATIMAAYTLGHAVDHVSGLNIGGESRPILPVEIGNQASIDAALDRENGDALFDVRHRFVASFVYELPRLEKRNALVRNAIGGWQLNGIVQTQTGFPMTVIEPNDIALRSLPNRPNQVCDPNEDAPNTVAQWFNTSCFQRLTLPGDAGKVGSAGRNTVRGPGFWRTDLGIIKNFTTFRSHRLQLRIEGFNVFNQTRFNQPGGTIGSPLFGVISSADDGRVVQLGIKYSF
jgi:outer membrane receptor protein involved in Fe transport